MSHKIAEITKNLVSDRYRSNPDFLEDEDPGADLTDKAEYTEVARKNYFEVMFVEDISQAEESKLRHDLKDMRLSNEQFAYGIVVQRSFEDALIALQFNFNIQAVVIRYAPSYHSKDHSGN